MSRTSVSPRHEAAAGNRSGGGFLHGIGRIRRQIAGDRFLRVLLLITIGAFLLRLGVWWDLGRINAGFNSVYRPSVLSDLNTYMELGRQVAAGKFEGPFYYQPWYYTVFLPLCYLISGSSIACVILVQCLLGAATCYLAGLASARLAGRTAGYAAAVLTAISTPLLLYTPFHQNETLQAFHLTLLFYLSMRACEVGTLRHWAEVGAVAGVAILTRGNINLLLPGLAVAAVWSLRRRRAGWGRAMAGGLLVPAVALCVQLPFIMHNSRVTEKLTGPSTAAGAVLALGNSPEAPAGGRNPGLGAGPMEYPEAYDRMMAREREGESVFRQMWAWMRAEPAAFLELQFRKLLLFWDYREIPNNVSLYGEGQASLILRGLVPGRSGLLIALGLSGCVLAAARLWRRRSVRLAVLVYMIAAYWAATALFYILSRFRAPILPLLAVAAGVFVAWLLLRWQMFPAERRKLLLHGGLLFLAMFWLSTSAYDAYRRLEPAVMRLVRPAGTRVEFQGVPYQLDYGPMTFGGWEEIPLRPGQILTKRFPGFNLPGEVEWQLLVLKPGRMRFRVNGETFTRELGPAGFARVRFPVTPQEESFTVEVTGCSGEGSLLYDAQRDYGRSGLDGQPLPGEWLMRLYHTTPQP